MSVIGSTTGPIGKPVNNYTVRNPGFSSFELSKNLEKPKPDIVPNQRHY